MAGDQGNLNNLGWNMSYARNDIAVAVFPQSESDYLKSELEYHLDMIADATREISFHSLKAQSIMKELEANEGR